MHTETYYELIAWVAVLIIGLACGIVGAIYTHCFLLT